MTEENQIKERGPGPLMMSVYIILFLVIGAVLSITIYKKYFAYPAAKVTVINVFHAQTVRYISRELEKCSLGDATAMQGLLNCSKYNAETVIVAILKTILDKNPYNTTYNAVRSSSTNINDDDVGYVSLSSSGSNIIIKSCNKTPCKKEENRLQDSIEIE